MRQLGLREGLAVHGALRQGHFLSRLGVWERAKRLGAANPGRASEITAGVSTLTSPEEMGARFKAICLAPRGAPTPAGFQGSVQ